MAALEPVVGTTSLPHHRSVPTKHSLSHSLAPAAQKGEELSLFSSRFIATTQARLCQDLPMRRPSPALACSGSKLRVLFSTFLNIWFERRQFIVEAGERKPILL